MKTKTLFSILAAFIVSLAAISCGNSQKPETIKVNADLCVTLYQADEIDGSFIAKQPSLMEETVHIQELIRYQGNTDVTMPFHFANVEKYAEITRNNLEKRIAISVNGVVVSTPMVKMEITDGACSVLLSKEQALQLFPNIKVGNL